MNTSIGNISINNTEKTNKIYSNDSIETTIKDIKYNLEKQEKSIINEAKCFLNNNNFMEENNLVNNSK